MYCRTGITTGEADLDEDGFVSMGELHNYASEKVREATSAMKPEIYPGKEGYTIRFTKVPPGDPKKRYAKEVKRYIPYGDINFVGRKTLDAWRVKLGLSETEAKTIEDEILADVREQFREKLQHYERDFREALQHEPPLSETEIDSLRKNLKELLGLRHEHTQPIEVGVRASIEEYKQKLQQYEQLLRIATEQEYPLSESKRKELQQQQKSLGIKDKDIAAIETRITAEVVAYRKNLQQYEEAFRTATEQEYPLSESKRKELQKQQQNLGVKDEDIAALEKQIIADIEAYNKKLQDYEETLQHEMQKYGYPLSNESREGLKRYQQILEVRDKDVVKIEEKLTSQYNAILCSDKDLWLSDKELWSSEIEQNCDAFPHLVSSGGG